ncbi:MAG TPA: hypothetical protein VMM12_06685 [Longimicrobiales bacterium]|nr:hypothetical protein [Longimicrobiales bacterium]
MRQVLYHPPRPTPDGRTVLVLSPLDGEDPETSTAASHDPDTDDPRATDSPERAAARSRWARLLARIYEVFPLRCPDCGGGMRILAFLTEPEPVDVILRHLEFDQSRGG